MRRLLVVAGAIASALGLLSYAQAPPRAATVAPTASRHLSRPPRANWQVLGAARNRPTFYRPAGVAVDRRGRVYVSDSGNFRVVKLSRSGKILAVWGRRGSGPGAFGVGYDGLGPGDVALGPNGLVYVDDPGNRRIEVFSPTGRLRAVWHPGLPEPLRLAVDPTGNVFAAPPDGEVVKLSPRGEIVARWPIENDRHGGIVARDVALDGRGAVYVAASWLDSSHPGVVYRLFVQKFSLAGQRLASWDGVGGFLAAKPDGTLYVGNDTSLEVLDATGRAVGRWGPPRFAMVAAVALDARGNVYVADASANRVLELSAAGRALRQWGVGGTERGRFVAPRSIAVGRRGEIYVADSFFGPPVRIQRLSATGRSLAAWTGGIDRGLGVDGAGNVYVLAYPGRTVIRKYTPAGRLAAEWPLAGASSITARSGDVYVLADCSGVCVDTVRRGRVVRSWKLPPSVRATGDEPIAADARGSVYIAVMLGANSSAIYKASPRAASAFTIRRLAAPSSTVAGIAVDRQGKLHVSSADADRIERLSPRGKLLAAWARRGSAPGQFHRPAGVAVDARGNVYVADWGNSRIQKLAPAR